MLQLNEKGYELGGAISYHDMLQGRLCVGADLSAQRGVLPIRVGGDAVNPFNESGAHSRRDPQGIYIGAEAYDFFLFDAINLFYFFQITAVKMIYMF